MKFMQTLSLVILAVAFSQASFAQCPAAIGEWSTDAGTMLSGRATETWCGADGNPIQGGQPGNTQNAMSWDGVTLGGQWAAWGMFIDSNGAVLITDTVDPGTGDGTRVYSTDYNGGEFWLSKTNSWANGVNHLTGSITSYNVMATLTIQGGVNVGVTSDIIFTGEFENCVGGEGCAIRFEILGAQLAWHPGFGGSMPDNYPYLMCGGTTAEAFDVPSITGEIGCPVSTQNTSWGSLKSLYK